MTEAEWLTGVPASDPPARTLANLPARIGEFLFGRAPAPDLSSRMLAVVRNRGSDRQFRLLACAELRRFAWLDPVMAHALVLAEQLADGNAPVAEVSEFGRRTVYEPLNPLVTPAIGFVANALRAGDPMQRFPPLFRDIFGNPFRPVTFSPEWRTDTAVSLARAMYEARDFSALPILADALQDAGCDDEDVLSHCRDTSATHVRGCWVVDRVLGNS
jgi:hypothetical protein